MFHCNVTCCEFCVLRFAFCVSGFGLFQIQLAHCLLPPIASPAEALAKEGPLPIENRVSLFAQLVFMKNIFLLCLLLCGYAYVAAQGTSSHSMAKSVGLYVFPDKDQTPEQQSKDEDYCYKWAVQQSGIDPVNPPKVDTAKVDKSRQGEVLVGGAKGAAAGAAIGAIDHRACAGAGLLPAAGFSRALHRRHRLGAARPGSGK
jgi:hypothetical protein